VLLLSCLLKVDFDHLLAHIFKEVRWYTGAFVHLECSGCFGGFGGKVLIGGQIANGCLTLPQK
jgi:hypothetical protein